jgi:hypothetical protein
MPTFSPKKTPHLESAALKKGEDQTKRTIVLQAPVWWG